MLCSGRVSLVAPFVPVRKILIPADIYFFKVNNTGAMCAICLKLTKKTSVWRQWCHSGVFIVKFEQISHIMLVFLLLTSNKAAGKFYEISFPFAHVIDLDLVSFSLF